MSRVLRQLNRLRDITEQTNDETDKQESALLYSLANQILIAGDVLEFTQANNESILFTSGLFPGFAVACQNAVIRGAPGAVINGIVTVSSVCTLEGLHFKSTGETSNALRLLQVEDGGVAIIKNCTFERLAGDTSSVAPADGYAHLAVMLGGKAKAFSCTFTSNLASGAMNGAGLYAWSDAANPPANLDVVASLNRTTHTLQNGTATAVVT
jgi:hypothetical protein